MVGASTSVNSAVPARRTRGVMPLRLKMVFVSLITCAAIAWICDTPPARARAFGV